MRNGPRNCGRWVLSRASQFPGPDSLSACSFARHLADPACSARLAFHQEYFVFTITGNPWKRAAAAFKFLEVCRAIADRAIGGLRSKRLTAARACRLTPQNTSPVNPALSFPGTYLSAIPMCLAGTASTTAVAASLSIKLLNTSS